MDKVGILVKCECEIFDAANPLNSDIVNFQLLPFLNRHRRFNWFVVLVIQEFKIIKLIIKN